MTKNIIISIFLLFGLTPLALAQSDSPDSTPPISSDESQTETTAETQPEPFTDGPFIKVTPDQIVSTSSVDATDDQNTTIVFLAYLLFAVLAGNGVLFVIFRSIQKRKGQD